MATTAQPPRTDPIPGNVDRLERIFASATSKHEAHATANAVMDELGRSPEFLTAVLRRHIAKRGAFAAENYPVLSMMIASNPHFELVANAWIPMPDGDTDLSTKAIHHHGELLLTTSAAFGPGYDHWTFTTPRQVDAERDLWEMELLTHGRHKLHEVAFVDAYIAHLPMFPASLSVTYCLWSSRSDTNWKDTLKRVPVLQRNSAKLRRAATKVGLAKQLELKNAEYFDFHPSPDGFVGMPEREEFQRGPNEDHLHSLFHVVQGTGNDALAPEIAARLDAEPPPNAALARRLLADLEAGTPIAGRLSPGHTDLPHANFRSADIERALAARAAR
jgi:hypothetical protein